MIFYFRNQLVSCEEKVKVTFSSKHFWVKNGQNIWAAKILRDSSGSSFVPRSVGVERSSQKTFATFRSVGSVFVSHRRRASSVSRPIKTRNHVDSSRRRRFVETTSRSFDCDVWWRRWATVYSRSSVEQTTHSGQLLSEKTPSGQTHFSTFKKISGFMIKDRIVW